MTLQDLINKLNEIEDKKQEVLIDHEDNELILTLWDNTKGCQARAFIQEVAKKGKGSNA